MILNKCKVAPGYSTVNLLLDAWTSAVYMETPTHNAVHVEIVVELNRWVKRRKCQKPITQNRNLSQAIS